MAKDTGAKATPAKPAPALKKQNSSSTKQSSILGFFSKGPASIGSTAKKPANDSNGTPINGTPKAQISTVTKQPAFKKTIARNPTPVPSSDAAAPSSQENGETDEVEDIGLPSPMTPAKRNVKQDINGVAFSSPSRKVSHHHLDQIFLMLIQRRQRRSLAMPNPTMKMRAFYLPRRRPGKHRVAAVSLLRATKTTLVKN